MKRTSFFDKHKSLGAKIVPFAGFEMPMEYEGITKEHMAVRESVGVFDVSHMGEIWVKGERAQEFVQRVTSNDASALKPGDAQYSCLPNGQGGIVDDLLVYCYETAKYMLVVNASNIDKDFKWLVSQNDVDVELENTSDNISQLAIQGPNAVATLQKLTDIDLSAIKFYTFTTGKFADVDNVILSATGYTGAGGFELYFYNEFADKIWDAIFDAGEEFDIKPAGLGARDTLRLEMGYCLYGNDIDDTTSPIEAGLGWITKFTDGKNFIDKEYLLRQKSDGVTRRLKGFEMTGRGIPRKGYEIVDSEGNLIGKVTSGTMSPVLGKGIGMGYLKTGNTKPGTQIFIKVRNKTLEAKVVKLPFI